MSERIPLPGWTRQARQQRILALIQSHDIASQAELAELLALDGISVSQGTLSKDLLDIGAVRVRGHSGSLVYAPPGAGGQSDRGVLVSRLARICQEVLTGAESSANLAVLKTPPGAAQYFASAIDTVGDLRVLGSIAGDDTVVVIARSADGGAELVEWFAQMSRTGTREETPGGAEAGA